jgi:hypothetical protein
MNYFKLVRFFTSQDSLLMLILDMLAGLKIKSEFPA